MIAPHARVQGRAGREQPRHSCGVALHRREVEGRPERDTEAFGLGELGASPFGSRMPKETWTSKEPTDYACVLIFVFLPWVSLTLLTCLRVCIMGVSYLT